MIDVLAKSFDDILTLKPKHAGQSPFGGSLF